MSNNKTKEIKTFFVVYSRDHQLDMAIVTGENLQNVKDMVNEKLGGLYHIKQIKKADIFKLDKQKEYQKYMDMIHNK